MSPPELLLAITPSLSSQLRSRTDEILAELVRTNHNTHIDDLSDDTSLSEIFRRTAQLATYETYAPLLARFKEKPCRESAVVSLLAPGLPDLLIMSSSTSGGVMKLFPKYRSLFSSSPFAAVSKRTEAFMFFLTGTSFDVMDDEDRLVKKIYSSSASNTGKRMSLGLDPASDEERMGTFIYNHVAPFATGFIGVFRSFLLIQGLFALDSKVLETMESPFLITFVEMMRYIDAEFDMILDCVANGVIPELEGSANVRHYLEPNLVANPERAAELRGIGRPSSRPGWCSLVWPNLRSITAISSGSFASYIPLARWFLGPNADILAPGYGSSECWIGSPYNPIEPNRFKPNSDIIIEFLDIAKSDCIASISQPWEVEVGKRYEIVLTTRDGLWRYRLRDVVDIAGFDQLDGTPIIGFVERRDVVMRFPMVMVTEKELRSAISSVAANTLAKIVDWTSTINNRRLPATIGFFIELADDEVSVVANFALAAKPTLNVLSQLNEEVVRSLQQRPLREPTIRIVVAGTFSDFRQLKIEEGVHSLVQVKTPVVLPKAAHVDWFSNRVVREL